MHCLFILIITYDVNSVVTHSTVEKTKAQRYVKAQSEIQMLVRFNLTVIIHH
jgi:hypothetical protein